MGRVITYNNAINESLKSQLCRKVAAKTVVQLVVLDIFGEKNVLRTKPSWLTDLK